MTKQDNREVSELVAGILTTLAVMSLVPIALEYLVNKQRDTDYWMQYLSVEPITLDQHVEGPIINMQSVARIHRPVDVEHHDALYCRNPDTGRMAFVSEQRVAVRFVEPTLLGHEDEGAPPAVPDGYAVVDGEWEYAGRMPSKPTDCQMTANPTIIVSPGVRKGLQIKSRFFKVGPVSDA